MHMAWHIPVFRALLIDEGVDRNRYDCGVREQRRVDDISVAEMKLTIFARVLPYSLQLCVMPCVVACFIMESGTSSRATIHAHNRTPDPMLSCLSHI